MNKMLKVCLWLIIYISTVSLFVLAILGIVIGLEAAEKWNLKSKQSSISIIEKPDIDRVNEIERELTHIDIPIIPLLDKEQRLVAYKAELIELIKQAKEAKETKEVTSAKKILAEASALLKRAEAKVVENLSSEKVKKISIKKREISPKSKDDTSKLKVGMWPGQVTKIWGFADKVTWEKIEGSRAKNTVWYYKNGRKAIFRHGGLASWVNETKKIKTEVSDKNISDIDSEIAKYLKNDTFELNVGMTKKQVDEIWGTPTKVESAYSCGHYETLWEYGQFWPSDSKLKGMFYYKRVKFKDGKISYWTKDSKIKIKTHHRKDTFKNHMDEGFYLQKGMNKKEVYKLWGLPYSVEVESFQKKKLETTWCFETDDSYTHTAHFINNKLSRWGDV